MDLHLYSVCLVFTLHHHQHHYTSHIHSLSAMQGAFALNLTHLHTHSHVKAYAFRGHVGFSILPKDTSTCRLKGAVDRTANIPTNGQPALPPRATVGHLQAGLQIANTYLNQLLVTLTIN